MANSVTGFLEKLVAAAGDYNAAKVGSLQFLKGVYLDVRPEVARAGQTIQIYFPDVGAFTDQQANDWVPDDINPAYTSVVFNQRPGKAILVRDFEQWQTAVAITEKFIDPMYKRGLEYMNGQIASQMTLANFNSNTAIQSTGTPTLLSTTALGNGSTIKLSDIALAWGTLAGAKVPVDNPEDLSIFTHSDVHSNMLTDKDLYQESLIGATIAQRERETADLGLFFKFAKRWDQQCGKANSLGVTTTSGTVSSVSTVTLNGSSTKFTSEFEVGDTYYLSADTASPKKIMQVASITSDTAMVATAAHTASITSGTVVKCGYTSLAMHRYAIALAVRPLELVNSGDYIQSRIIMLEGIPFRVMLSYQHLKGGWLLSVDTGCAVKVIRPDFGVIIKS